MYEARHEITRKRCAVKVLRSDELAGDAESTKRFFREARAAGLIECPHVVSALDSGVDENGRAFYVMEYLSGEDLSQVLERVGQLTPEAAIKVALQAAIGIASAHALHIVHRDIKPGNLFLVRAPSGEVTIKVLDFGVAKVRVEVFEESGGSPTQSGTLLGTLQYMSPAQLKRASAIDETADLWSLGILLYECVTGELPWSDADGLGELVTSILTRPVPALRALAPWASPELEEIVLRATARDDSRYRSARELRAALAALPDAELPLRAEELVAPTEQERARGRELARLAAEEARARPTDAPLVASIRPPSTRRFFAYAAAAAAASLAVYLPAHVATNSEPAEAVATGRGPAAAARDTGPPALGLPPVTVLSDVRASANHGFAATSTSAVAELHSQAAAPLSSLGLHRDASRAAKRRAATSAALPAASTAAPPPPPPAQTPLERMGGKAQWHHPDVVAAP